MQTLHAFLFEPFVEYVFMRRALVSVLFLSLSSAPIGVFLIMRRMSLMGDAMSHAVLPGAAAGYIFAGLSVTAMSVGGFLAGMFMALGAVLASRFTTLKEDAHLAAFYLGCLALGVAMVSKHGSSVDLLSLLFGSLLSVDREALALVAITSTFSLALLALIYRPLMMESVDPDFMTSVGEKGWLWHMLFQILVVANLVAGFQALGTLMSVGLMMLPAVCAKLWFERMEIILPLSSILAFLSGFAGLLISYRVDLPSGPAIILCCSAIYVFSLIFGTAGGLARKRAGKNGDEEDPPARPA